MRPQLLAVALVAWLAALPQAAGQSLADVARAAESARAAGAGRPPAKVYTNKDLPAGPGTAPRAVSADAPAPAPAPPKDTPSASAVKASSDTAPQEPRDETYWRERARPLHDRLDSARALADETKRQADALMRSADRCFQIGVVCQDYTESLRLQDTLKTLAADVASAERDVAALEDEARRAGVPPGWLRP